MIRTLWAKLTGQRAEPPSHPQPRYDEREDEIVRKFRRQKLEAQRSLNHLRRRQRDPVTRTVLGNRERGHQ